MFFFVLSDLARRYSVFILMEFLLNSVNDIFRDCNIFITIILFIQARLFKSNLSLVISLIK